MGKIAHKIKKISKMNKSVAVKKMLSFDDVYVVGYRERKKQLLPVSGKGKFKAIPLSRKFWYSDPVIFTNDSRSYLFLEAFDRDDLRGKVACCELTSSGPTTPRVIIDEPFHMSFPTVFRFGDGIYMIPETSADKSLRLYRAADFPDNWELVKRFDLGRLFVDTVILDTNDGSFKILTCEVSPDREYECRFQKFTVSRTGDDDFVLTEDKAFNSKQEYDLRSRNGGAVFTLDGKKYVAAQESTFSEYGLYMNFYPYDDSAPQIASKPSYRLTKKNFVIKDGPKGEGVHSYCFNDYYEVVDLKYLEFAPRKIVNKIIKKHPLVKKELSRNLDKELSDSKNIFENVYEESFDPDSFREKHYGNPHRLNKPLSIVYDNDDPAGIAAFLGMKLLVGKKEIPVCQVVDVAVNDRYRGKGYFSKNIAAFEEENKEADFIFALPNDASLPRFLNLGYTKEHWLCHYIYVTAPFSFIFGKNILTGIPDKLFQKLLWLNKVKINKDENLSITNGMSEIPVSDSELKKISKRQKCHFLHNRDIFKWKQAYNPDLKFYWATLRKKDGHLLGYALCHLRPRLNGNFVIIDDYAVSRDDSHKRQTLQLLFSSLSCLGNITEVPFANTEMDGKKLSALHFINACKFPFPLRGGPFIVSSGCKYRDAIKDISMRNIDSDVL
ncbi:MAG: GNAT family N-acetyltransferase [Butyrivibrio sp.]|nr:GNAT family N-acetyltransferase [Butyrivibrio sp.]